jgi:two-component system nitrogen regulation response regulator GlnG
LLPEFLPVALRGLREGAGRSDQSALDLGGLTAFIQDQLRAGSTTLYSDYQSLADKHLLSAILRHTSGNLSQAARILGITRATLRTKLQALGIPIERPTSSEDGLSS